MQKAVVLVCDGRGIFYVQYVGAGRQSDGRIGGFSELVGWVMKLSR